MPEIDDNFIQPEPLSSEHADRFVKGAKHTPFEFEEVLANPEQDDRRMASKHEVRNFQWLYVVIGLLVVALIGRAAFLQIYEGQKYRGLAEGNRLRSLVLQAPRGILYDRHGEQLVENVPNYQLAMRPVDIPTAEEERRAIFESVAAEFELSADELESIYQEEDVLSFNPVILDDEITREQSLSLQARADEFPGVQSIANAVRIYGSPEIMAHVVGYIGKLTAEEYEENLDYELTDYIGKAGVEQSYESTLRGNHGAQNVEVDALGQVLNVLGTEPPTPGSNLWLGLDLGLQKALYTALAKAVDRSEETKASAVAINPQNGEVLAMVSIPSFDVNSFSRGIEPNVYAQLIEDEDQPLFNRPLSGSYSPGSTFKPFVAVESLAQGKISEATNFLDEGVITVGGQEFKGWKPGGHGNVNIISAIANSVNGFFYSIGGGFGDIDGIGISGIHQIGKAFGFGQDTAIDLPGENKGLMPTPEWKEDNYDESWFLGDTYNASIGQGFVLVSPLQLANATAAIANGGTLYWPHFGKIVEDEFGNQEAIEPRILNDQISDQKSIEIVRRGMRATVDGGTGRLLADLPVAAAGKTGTAQFGTGEPHAWFTSFAPYDKPTIAIAVLVEQAGEGSDFSAPVAHEVLQYYFTRDATN